MLVGYRDARGRKERKERKKRKRKKKKNSKKKGGIETVYIFFLREKDC